MNFSEKKVSVRSFDILENDPKLMQRPVQTAVAAFAVSNICQQASLYFSLLLTACYKRHPPKSAVSFADEYLVLRSRSCTPGEGQSTETRGCKMTDAVCRGHLFGA